MSQIKHFLFTSSLSQIFCHSGMRKTVRADLEYEHTSYSRGLAPHIPIPPHILEAQRMLRDARHVLGDPWSFWT